MIRLRPGSSTAWNLPSRSTTQALCCGTMRTPSIVNTTMTAMKKIHTEYFSVAGTCDAAIATTSAMISLTNMVPPRFEYCVASRASGRTRPGHGQCVAFGREDVEHAARIDGCIAFDVRLPSSRRGSARARAARPGSPTPRTSPAGHDPSISSAAAHFWRDGCAPGRSPRRQSRRRRWPAPGTPARARRRHRRRTRRCRASAGRTCRSATRRSPARNRPVPTRGSGPSG